MVKKKPRRPGVGAGGPGGAQQQRQRQQISDAAINDANTPSSTASSQRRNGKGRPQQQHRHDRHRALRMPQDRARAAFSNSSSSRTRPASSKTVFAVREFMTSESVVDAGPTGLGRAPLPSLPRLLEQIRVMSRGSSANATSGGNMDATVLILSDLWEEASSMREELELVQEQLARTRARAGEGLVDGDDVDESAAAGTVQTFVTARERGDDIPARAQVDDGCNVITNTVVGDDDDDDDDDGGRRALLLLLSNPNVAQYLSGRRRDWNLTRVLYSVSFPTSRSRVALENGRMSFAGSLVVRRGSRTPKAARL